MPDHVHIFLSFPPTISISEAVQILKGTSSMRLREEAPEVEQKTWGAPLWAQGYFASTVNDKTTSQTVRRYIQNQKKVEKQLELF